MRTFLNQSTNTIKDLDFVPKVDEQRHANLINRSIGQDSGSENQILEEAYCFTVEKRRQLAAFVSCVGSKSSFIRL